MLLNWLKALRFRLKKLFVVHGEEESANALAQRAKDDFGIITEVPNYGDCFELE